MFPVRTWGLSGRDSTAWREEAGAVKGGPPDAKDTIVHKAGPAPALVQLTGQEDGQQGQVSERPRDTTGGRVGVGQGGGGVP